MIIKHEHLLLCTITIDDIELLRIWRNDKRVNEYLVTNDIITPEAQLKWFNSLDPARSIYFLLRVNTCPIGIVYANNINLTEKNFEGSVLIGDNNYLHSTIPVKAAIILSYFFFEKLDFHTAYSTVHIQNKSAMDFDRKLGYTEIGRDGDFARHICTKADYLNASSVFKKILFKATEPEIIYQTDDTQFLFLPVLK